MSTRLEHSVLPGVERMVPVQTVPRAVCFLYYSEAKGQRLQLDADDQGIVRFHTKASKESKPIKMYLECTGEDGTKTKYDIVLRGDTNPSVPIRPQAASLGTGKLHPALKGEPMALSNEELLRRGYPPRPDPLKAPARYARWHRIVSQPFTQVNPRRVSHPEVSFSRPELRPKLRSPTLPLPPPVTQAMFNSNSNTWSGAYYTNPSSQFFWIQADWDVPRVWANVGALSYSAVAEWVGLDNSGTDLYQSGTDSECWVFTSPIDGVVWTFTNYWMWIETLPFSPWAVPNFPISPGDWVSVDIFVADPNGNTWFQDGSNGGLTPADNSVWFMVYNNTGNLSFWGTLPTTPESGGGVSSTGFTGSTAEFIIERPTYNGGPVPLASFGITAMHGCYYGDSEYGDRSWPNIADGSSPFDANLTYINMQDNSNNNLLALPISYPDPSNPGDYAILWLWTNYL
jgi:hypothetical protein